MADMALMDVTYVCAECGAEDKGRYFVGEPIDHVASAINCWNCHAGRGLTVEKMIQQKRGMFAQRLES